MLEPSSLLITSSLSLGQVSIPDDTTNQTYLLSSSSSQATLATCSLVQSSGLGLQGQLAYTLSDNTTFYVRGGAGFYSGGTA